MYRYVDLVLLFWHPVTVVCTGMWILSCYSGTMWQWYVQVCGSCHVILVPCDCVMYRYVDLDMLFWHHVKIHIPVHNTVTGMWILSCYSGTMWRWYVQVCGSCHVILAPCDGGMYRYVDLVLLFWHHVMEVCTGMWILSCNSGTMWRWYVQICGSCYVILAPFCCYNA